MADSAEPPTPADVVEAKTPPPEADKGPRVEEVINRVSGPLAIMGTTIKSLTRYDNALSAMERIVFSRVSAAKRVNHTLPDEYADLIWAQVQEIWLSSYEAGIVCAMAAADVGQIIPALIPEIERQTKTVDRTFINGAVKVSVICFLLNREPPDALKDLNFEDGALLTARYDQDYDAVQALIEQLTDEQKYRLNVYKLVRAVMTRRQTPVDVQACLLTDEEIEIAKAELGAMAGKPQEPPVQPGEQVAQDSHTPPTPSQP